MPGLYAYPKQVCTERQQAWELYQKGWSTAQIADELNVHQSTIYRWIKRLKQEGELAFAPRKRMGRPSRLTLEQQKQLHEWLLEGPKAHGFWGDFWTVERIQQLIERQFTILYSSAAVHQLLHRLGWSLPKVSAIRLRQAEQMAALHAELEATMRLSQPEG
ncbi:MAG: helix-turn-helix domain-containing protein [Caldilineaceae bacterium]